MAKNEKNGFIDSAKEILDCYYGKIIEDSNLSESEKITLFILSFKNKINMMDQNSYQDMLIFFNLNSSSFLNSLKQLHDKELCDIFQDKAIKVSDQSLSDYLIIDFIFTNKTYKIRDFFNYLFPKYSKEIVTMLSIIGNFNNTKEWKKYLKDEIKHVYNNIISEEYKDQYLIQFCTLIPIEALAYANTKIESSSYTEYLTTQNEFETKKNSSRVDDKIIEILCSLSNSLRYKDAATLLIDYLEIKQDKIYEVYSAIEMNFNIEEDWQNYLDKRISIFEVFSNLKKVNEVTSLLIVNVARIFLQFTGEKIIDYGENGHFMHYTLIDGNYLIEFHKKIFEVLFEVYELQYPDINEQIDRLLYNYPVYELKNGFIETVSSDLKCIKELFFKNLSKLDLRKEAIVFKLYSEINLLGVTSQPFLNYQQSERQSIYRVFSSAFYLNYDVDKFDYEEIEEIRKQSIIDIFNEYSNDLLWLFNILYEFQSDELLNDSQLGESLRILYYELGKQDKIKMLTDLLNSNFIISNSYDIDFYIEKVSFEEGQKILSSIKKSINGRWYLSNLLFCNTINDFHVGELISFLQDLKNIDIINSLDIFSFENYMKYDSGIFDLLMSKYLNGEISGSFFISHYISEKNSYTIIDYVGYKHLSKIYLDNICDKEIDMSGTLFEKFMQKNDADFIFEFLKKLCISRLKLHHIDYKIHLKKVWISSFAEEGIRKYLDYLIENNFVIYVGMDPFLEEVLKTDFRRATDFNKNEVKNTEDENRLVNLYNLSLEIFDDEFTLELFEFIKHKKISSNFFENINLRMRTWHWSGSLVPVLDNEISFLNRLLGVFGDVKYISYASIINKIIEDFKEQKNNELLYDYLK